MTSDSNRRGLKVLLIFGVAFFGLLLTVYVMRVPLLQKTAEYLLKAQGFTDASLTVTSVNFDEVSISNLLLGTEIQAEDIFVGYSIASLMQGAVERVSVKSLHVDVSQPQTGPLQVILSLAEADERDQQTSGLTPIPDVTVSGVTVSGMFGERQFKATGAVKLSRDFDASGDILLQGQMNTAAGPVMLNGLELKFQGNIRDLSGYATLKNGVLRPGGEKQDWASILVSGHLKQAGKGLEFQVGANLLEGPPLFLLDGKHDVGENTGRADIDIRKIAFDKSELQPSDLTSYADDFPALDLIFSSQSQIFWDKEEIGGEALLLAEGFKMESGDFSVQSKNSKLSIGGTYNFDTGVHSARLKAVDQTINITQEQKEYVVSDIGFDLAVSDFGDSLNLESFTASVQHVADFPDFLPLRVVTKGTGKAGELTFDGKIADERKRVELVFNGQHNLQRKNGFISGEIADLSFSKNGLKPQELTSLLRDLEADIEGELELSAKAAWDTELGFSLPKVNVMLKGGSYKNKDFEIQDFSASVLSNKIFKYQPFEASISDISGEIFAAERTIRLEDAAANIVIDKGWNKADFILEKSTIIPVEGALIKQPLTFTISSEITEKELKFSGVATTDFLGKFSDIRGEHNLQSGAGSAHITIRPVEFAEEGLQPSDLVEGVDDALILTGIAGAEIGVDWHSSGWNGQGEVDLNNIGIRQDGYEIIGLSGQVEADSLQPLTISKAQKLTADRIVAAVGLSDPEIRFRVTTEDEIPVLYLDQMRVGIVGGTAIIQDAILDTGAAENSVKVQLSNLDLEEVMRLGDLEDVAASGSLSGFIPLVFDGRKVLVDYGLLETDGPGFLQLKSEKARSALSAGGSQTDLLFDVLENFQYSELSVKIKKLATGEDTVTLHTKGSNPNVENNRPVILNVNLSTNLDKIFNTLLDGYLLSEKALRATVKNRKN